MAIKKKKKTPAKAQKTIELSDQLLERLVKKATREASKKALAVRGSIVVIEKGWVVRKDKSGKVIAKISRLNSVPRPKKITLD